MQFGLCNASSTFQWFNVIRELPSTYAFIDDILVASTTEEEHLVHLRMLFQCFQEYGLSVNAAKCVFGGAELDFLGYKLSAEGIKLLPDRVQFINDYPKPSVSTETLSGTLQFLPSFLVNGRYLQNIVKIHETSLLRCVSWHGMTLKQNPDKCSPRQYRHLDYISQFSTDVRHISGIENTVADALSRVHIDSVTNADFIDFEAFAAAQQTDDENNQ
ncbi:hypothetical protein JTE90_002570 [Oedothorax gibbosus]|uniref:Reverse transcriptase domain-containing protein n=1 Tax=Oedothorax gibbosus TaxID=931172 RepID=A0AAV6TS10_9ARAC|nr:hypothetical protein JTE90_002570 [Oedothorax gibbosus]